MRIPEFPLTLEYQLTEEDVHRYCVSGRAQRCWRTCRRRKAGVLILAALGLFLVGLCYWAVGVRSGSLYLATTLAVLVALSWSREARAEHRVCQLARYMGLPRDLRLTFSPGGIAEESTPDDPEPDRTYTVSDVVEILRVDQLTVIRLRPAGGILIVPDRAFSTPEQRADFEEWARTWREAASGHPRPIRLHGPARS